MGVWGELDRDGIDATVDRKLAVSDIRRNFRGRMPVSTHKLIAGLVQKASVAILSSEF